MIIADTSVWIEFLIGNPKFVEPFETLLEQRNIIAIECVFGELLHGARNKREKEIIISLWENLPKTNVDNIWIQAGAFSSEMKIHSKGVGLIDLVIILSARQHRYQIWTLDKKLQNILSNSEIFNFS